MVKKFSVKKLAALLLVGLVAMPSMVSAQLSSMPMAPYVVSIEIGVNGYPSTAGALLQNAYVSMYKVSPVIAGVYEGTLVSIKSTGSDGSATFNVRPNDIVDFVGFTDLNKARNIRNYTFTAPPYKNFSATDKVLDRLCQINDLDKTTKMQRNGADSCSTSLGYPASDSSVVIIPKKYPTRRYGSIEVWAQETNDPLTRVRGAEISLYDELTGAKLGSATSDRGIVTFVVETNRPFYYQATKDGKNYGGRLASATETPRVFMITTDRQHNQNYYNGEKSAVMRLGAYPNNYQGNTEGDPDPAVAPTASLSVSRSTITRGESATLFWSSADSVYCVASGGWEGNQVLSGSKSVSPRATTTYSLTCTGVGGSVQKSVTVTVNPVLSTTPVERCVPFDASTARVTVLDEHPGYYFLTGFRDYSKAFTNKEEAYEALEVAKKNNLTQECTMSVPGTKDAIEYWLNANGTAPIGNSANDVGEDCINYNLSNVTVENRNSNYTLVEHLAGGSDHLIATKSTLAAANVMKSVWDKYGFNEICYVGRPDASMTYYKHYTTTPTPAEPCSSPYVMYQGVCTDPIPACKNPPVNSVPGSCVDKIENGVYTERYSFNCMSGYTKSGKECVPNYVPTAADYKPTNVHFSTYENNIGVLWDAPRVKLATDNGYAVFMKKGTDITTSDVLVGITPVYVPFGTTQYTFQNLERNNKYFFIVGTGKYTNGSWVSYGNYSINAYTFIQPEITPIAAPTVSFSASPTNITVGQSSTLTWSSTKATYCFAWGSWGSSPADDALSGSKTVSPVTTSTYNFTCTNAGGDTKKSVTITVTPATPTPITTISISASPRNIFRGQSSTLSWSAVNTVNCQASNGWSGTKAASGSITVAPNVTTTYALTCNNTVTNAAYAASTTVTVTPASPTSCVKPASVTKAMAGGTSWVLPTTNKTYNVKVENITSDNKVQFLINGTRLVGVTANAVPNSFSDLNSSNGNDGTIQVYSTLYSPSNPGKSLVAFKISEKVPTGSVKCSTSNEIIRLMYVNDPQTYTSASGKTFNVTLERVYGGATGDEKKADLLINGDRMIGVPWNDTAKQHFGASHPGDDGTVTISFIDNTGTPNFAVITILAD